MSSFELDGFYEISDVYKLGFCTGTSFWELTSDQFLFALWCVIGTEWVPNQEHWALVDYWDPIWLFQIPKCYRKSRKSLTSGVILVIISIFMLFLFCLLF